MTKLKSKKLSKSTIAIILMAIAMVAILSFGATFALFSAQAKEVKTSITTGTVTLSSQGSFTITSGLVFPGQKVYDSSISGSEIKVSSTGDDTLGEYVAVKITATVNDVDASSDALEIAMADSSIAWVADTTLTNVYVYCGASGTTPAGLTSSDGAKAVIKDITFAADDHSTQTGADSYTFENNLMGKAVVVKIQFGAIQKTANTTTTTVAQIANYLFGSSGVVDDEA